MWTAVRVVLLIVATVVLAPYVARAQSPYLARAQSQRVYVRIAAETAQREALLLVLPELLQRLAVELVTDDKTQAELLASDGTPYLATCLIDLRAADEAVLYVHDPARDRILQRRVARSAGSDELVREELGHMLLAAIEALQAGATLGAPSAEVPVPAVDGPATTAPASVAAKVEPAPALAHEAPQVAPNAKRVEQPSESQSEGWALRAAILYEVAALGDEPFITHGPEVALEIRSPLPLRLSALLSAQYRFPFELEADPIGMRSQTFALRALATVEHALSTSASLRFGLGAGVDIARVTPRVASDANIRETDARTLTLAVLRALLGVDVRVASALSIWIAVAADLDLDRSEYVLVQSDGDEQSVSEPWRVRPSLLLGAALP